MSKLSASTKLLLAVIFLFISGLSVCGCSPSEPVLAPDDPELFTKTPTQTATATKTILWFPSTNTPTPFSTRTTIPTPNRSPGIDQIVLTDNFNSQGYWNTIRKEHSSAIIANNELTIAISETGLNLLCLRKEPILNDFYLEMDASPSLCRQNDNYGLILRASGEQLYYRFAVNCNGMMRLERMKNGYYAILQDWIPSGQVPVGSPAYLKLGVWAFEDEMRFFINDYYQFSISGLTWMEGQIGVFARSESNNALSVSFSELKVYDLDLRALSGISQGPTQTPFPSQTANAYDRTITPVSTAQPFPTFTIPTNLPLGDCCHP